MADGTSGAAWEQLVAQHYALVWGRTGGPQPFAGARALDLPAQFTVLAYAPSNIRPYWTYATCGMSQAFDERAVELFVFAPYSAPEVVELLYATAHYHRAGANLSPGDAVNFGRPWMGASACTFGLVSLPYLEGPQMETAHLAGRQVKVYWLVPVTASEVAFRKTHGLAALEAQFDRVRLQFARPGRDPVV
ncbi:MAG TPA: suppressor of fused domain protein [Caulobacteraceae bacterium]|nr:suppressor of fused domain protein [Caulobacteraceae bacterium]